MGIWTKDARVFFIQELRIAFSRTTSHTLILGENKNFDYIQEYNKTQRKIIARREHHFRKSIIAALDYARKSPITLDADE